MVILCDFGSILDCIDCGKSMLKLAVYAAFISFIVLTTLTDGRKAIRCHSSLKAGFLIRCLLPFNRHQLSYGDCLEVKRENNAELFYAVFCTTVVHNDMHTNNYPHKSEGICFTGVGLSVCVSVCDHDN